MNNARESDSGKRYLSQARLEALRDFVSGRRELREAFIQVPASTAPRFGRRAFGLGTAAVAASTFLGLKIGRSQAQTETSEMISPAPLNLLGIFDAVAFLTIDKDPNRNQAPIAIELPNGFSAHGTLYISPNPDHELPPVEIEPVLFTGRKSVQGWSSLMGNQPMPVGEKDALFICRLNLNGVLGSPDGGWALTNGYNKSTRHGISVFIVQDKLYASYDDGQTTTWKNPAKLVLISDLPQVNRGDVDTDSVLSAVKITRDGMVSVSGPESMLVPVGRLKDDFFTPGETKGVYPEIFGSINASHKVKADLLAALEL